LKEQSEDESRKDREDSDFLHMIPCSVCGREADTFCEECEDVYCSVKWMGNPGCYAKLHKKGNRSNHMCLPLTDAPPHIMSDFNIKIESLNVIQSIEETKDIDERSDSSSLRMGRNENSQKKKKEKKSSKKNFRKLTSSTQPRVPRGEEREEMLEIEALKRIEDNRKKNMWSEKLRRTVLSLTNQFGASSK